MAHYVSEDGTLFRLTKAAWKRWVSNRAVSNHIPLVEIGTKVGEVVNVANWDAADAQDLLDQWRSEELFPPSKPDQMNPNDARFDS